MDPPTPDAADSPQTKLAAEKDRECPFCKTKFTSSSLGRHLDLYIREKNPKAPDGKHDVDEIRKLRGNVTRRQARTPSTTKREDSTPSSSKPTSLREHRSPSASAASAPRSQRNDGGPVKISMNKVNWTNTGVINDLPLAAHDGAVGASRPWTPPRRASVKEELNRRHTTLEERDRARAAEYALREVLQNVKAAKYALPSAPIKLGVYSLTISTRSMRAHPQSPFEFNLFSLSFPTMCLQCLSAPPSLSFGTTVSKERSWSIDPPNSYHFEALQRWLAAKMRDWRIRRKALGIARPAENGSANGDGEYARNWSMSDPEADEHEAACIAHLNDAYQAWQNLSEMQKHEKWHSECVTALTQEQDRHRETKNRLERLEHQVQSLQNELNSRHDNPVLTSIPLSQQTALQTFDSLTDLAAWDYDKLITKWRTRILHERAQQHPLPPTPTQWTASTPDTARSPPCANGANSYHKFQQQASKLEHLRSEANGIDEDEHLTDAPGEEDDTDPAALMDRRLLDPSLQEKPNEKQDTVMHGEGSEDRS